MGRKSDKVKGTIEAWESGELGRDEEFVRVASREAVAALDQATNLKPVSIRLPVELIEELKMLAEFNGVGYQPLMRDILQRWTRSELRIMAIKYHEHMKEEAGESDDADAPLRHVG